MQLRKLLRFEFSPSTPSSSSEEPHTPSRSGSEGKLHRKQLGQLTPEDKRIYLMAYVCACFIYLSTESQFPSLRRNRVAKAARLAWPGNDIPIFRGNKDNLKKLDNLVPELNPTCSSKHFQETAIRRHILDTLSERRRQIKRGYDYENAHVRC